MTATQLERDGVRLYYETHGTRTARLPLFLTHGYSSSSAMWAPNLERLSADRLVVTWDLRGHGRTVTPADPAFYSHEQCVDDMAALLDVCEIDRAVVGGLSLGGYLSLSFLGAHPDRVAALGLFDTGPGFKNAEARERWNEFAESRAQAFEAQGLEALPKSPEVRLAGHDPVGLALAARYIMKQHDAAVISSLSDIGVPTLVIVGENDRAFLAGADYMASHIPGAEKQVLASAGHAANIDQPGAFNDAVVAFLDRVG
jgi:pimeloyl-ACP methyl ester carboxylesterase